MFSHENLIRYTVNPPAPAVKEGRREKKENERELVGGGGETKVRERKETFL